MLGTVRHLTDASNNRNKKRIPQNHAIEKQHTNNLILPKITRCFTVPAFRQVLRSKWKHCKKSSLNEDKNGSVLNQGSKYNGPRTAVSQFYFLELLEDKTGTSKDSEKTSDSSRKVMVGFLLFLFTSAIASAVPSLWHKQAREPEIPLISHILKWQELVRNLKFVDI